MNEKKRTAHRNTKNKSPNVWEQNKPFGSLGIPRRLPRNGIATAMNEREQ